MSGLKQIRLHTNHMLNPDFASLAGIPIRDLQQFAAGYISICRSRPT